MSAVARRDERAISRAARRVVKERLPVLLFALSRLKLVAQPKVNVYLWRDSPAVVEIAAVVVDQEGTHQLRRKRSRTRQTEQQIGHGVARTLPRNARGELPVEVERPAREVGR